jgi:hypothetical protein
MKKLKLSYDTDNIHILGLITSAHDIQLTLAINQCLHIKLSRNISVMNKLLLPPEGFSSFLFVEERYSLQYFYILFLNRLKGYSLFSSFPQFDYIFALMGGFSTVEINNVIKKLKRVNEITSILSIPAISMKSELDYVLLYE